MAYFVGTLLITWIKGYRPKNSGLLGCCEAVSLGEVLPPYQRYKVPSSVKPLNPWTKRHDGPSKRREPLNQRHDVTSQKTWTLKNKLWEPQNSLVQQWTADSTVYWRSEGITFFELESVTDIETEVYKGYHNHAILGKWYEIRTFSRNNVIQLRCKLISRIIR